MIDVLLFAAVILTALTFALSLAHALELPGKLRLHEQQYLAVQTIYYPGFTFGGAAEPLSILALAALLFLLPIGGQLYLLTGIALALMIATQLVFWLVVQPVNRHWLAGMTISQAAARFFQTGKVGEAGGWVRFRNRWEHGHLVRAGTSGVAFVLTVLAIFQR